MARVLIDDHGSQVCEEVWELYRRAIARFGALPTLIEWDNNIPSLATLVAESRARRTHPRRSGMASLRELQRSFAAALRDPAVACAGAAAGEPRHLSQQRQHRVSRRARS